MNNDLSDSVLLKKKAISGLYWVFGTALPSQLISWVITIMLARILSPNDYGLLAMGMLLSGFLVSFNELGLGPAIIQKSLISNDELNTCFWLIFAIGVFLCGISYLSAPLVSLFFSEPRLKNMIRLLSLNFVLGGLYAVPYNLLYRELLFDKRGITDFLSKISNGASALLLAMNGLGVWSLIYGMLVGEIVKLIFSFAFMPWIPRLRFSYNLVRGMMTFGYKFAADRVLWYFYSTSDFLIAGKCLGKILLGYYSMAFQLASMPVDKLVVPIKQIAFPMFSRIQEDNDLLKKSFLKLSRNVAFATFPIFCGMAALSDKAILFFLSDKWMPMLFAFKALCYASGFRTLSALTDPLLLSKGRPDIGVINTLICAIFMPFFFLVGSVYGLTGLSLVWLTVYPVLFFIMMKRSIKVIGLSLREYLSSLLLPILATCFMFFIVVISDNSLASIDSIALRLFSLCGIGAVAYVFFIILFAKDFVSDIMSLIKR